MSGDKFPHYNYASVYTRKRLRAHNYLNTGIPTSLKSEEDASDNDKGREFNL